MKNLKTKFNALTLAILILTNCVANAQSNQSESKEIRPMKIGAKMPDIEIGKIYNDPVFPDGKIVRISDYKGKLLLLDTWGILCGACIAQFPKLQKLQAKFGESIKILPVAVDKKMTNTRRTLEKWKGTPKEMKLPTIVIELNQPEYKFEEYFPDKGRGGNTIVWIDQNGYFMEITDEYAVNEKNIQDILNGIKLPFREKKIPGAYYHPLDSPVREFLVRKNPKVKLKTGSVLASYIDTIGTSTGLEEFTKDPDYYHLLGQNSTMYELFRSAYREVSEHNKQLFANFSIAAKKVSVETKNRNLKDRYEVMHYANNWGQYEFQDNHLFNYELTIAKSGLTRKDHYRYAIKDMERLFGVKTSIEKRKLKYLALKLKPNGIKDLTRLVRNPPMHQAGDADYNGYQYLPNWTLDKLVSGLNVMTPFRTMIVNETNYDQKINILKPIYTPDLKTIESFLDSYGLKLVEAETEIEVLVIKDAR